MIGNSPPFVGPFGCIKTVLDAPKGLRNMYYACFCIKGAVFLNEFLASCFTSTPKKMDQIFYFFAKPCHVKLY